MTAKTSQSAPNAGHLGHDSMVTDDSSLAVGPRSLTYLAPDARRRTGRTAGSGRREAVPGVEVESSHQGGRHVDRASAGAGGPDRHRRAHRLRARRSCPDRPPSVDRCRPPWPCGRMRPNPPGTPQACTAALISGTLVRDAAVGRRDARRPAWCIRWSGRTAIAARDDGGRLVVLDASGSVVAHEGDRRVDRRRRDSAPRERGAGVARRRSSRRDRTASADRPRPRLRVESAGSGSRTTGHRSSA